MIKKIVVLVGDGIGLEIMEVGLEVLEVLVEKIGFDYEIDKWFFGGVGIDAVGYFLFSEIFKVCREIDVIFLAVIGSF